MSDDKYALLRDPEMKEIVESFLEESKEILENLNSDLVELENSPKDDDLLNKIFRSFHTLKGTSGFLGLEKTTLVTHRCEDILNKLRKGQAELDADLMDVILAGYDKISALLVVIEENLNEDVEIDEIVAKLEETIKRLEGEPSASPNPLDEPPKVEDSPEKPKKKRGRPKKQKVEKKENNPLDLPATEEVKESTVKQINPLDIPVKEEVKNNSASNKIKETSESSDADKIINRNLNKNHKGESSIRVDVKRLDDLLNIVSELVLGRNQLQQVNEKISQDMEGSEIARALGEAAKQIDLMTNELQLVVMKTRMVKIGKVFNKFPRLVRDLSRETGKNVDLVIHGEDTELDKTLIEEINDPLVHLVRNSIDHGIEPPEERRAKGKPENGTIVLEAYPEGNNIVISIKDDGKGIDPDVIKEKAVTKGLISKEKADELSKQEIFNLIFLPGFSTAAKVTNISGRGVGMDVVKTNVKRLRGLINIDSEVDKGTTITIKLPLTLAIISGMVVRVDEEHYIIPLSNILEVVRLHVEDIHSIKGKEVIKVRDDVIPLVNIKELLYNQKHECENVWQYVIIVGIAENKYGIKVDETVGQKEIVIKSLGSYLGKVPGIAGSTIMGDGTVVMIVDLAEILNSILENVEG